MESNAESNNDGVLPPPPPLDLASVPKNTPVAKKTRKQRTVKQKQGEPKEDNEGESNDDMPIIAKTPKTPSTSSRAVGETPRRSARKSVRPPLDYKDIIEKNLMASASKEKKVTATADQEEEDQAQKWTLAEVGRSYRKRSRSRKSKRGAGKKARSDEEIGVVAEEDEEEEEEGEDAEDGEEQLEIMAFVSHITADDKDEMLPNEEIAGEPVEEAVKEAVEECEQEVETKVAVEEENPINVVVEVTKKKSRKSIAVNSEELDDLGVIPLAAEESFHDEEEMPSLIMLEDVEHEGVLNLTFDANEPAADAEVNPSQQPDDNPTKQTKTGTKKSPKSNSNFNSNSDKGKPRGYQFATPYKGKSERKFKFCEDPPSVELFAKNPKLEVPGEQRRRKRSKSISGANETKANKTVSFFSPIEVTVVNDIDKRWEGLNNSHVTQRRKRSKSLDEIRPQVSRIPKPKAVPPVRAAATPSKQMPRKKLPNFAAIHQKQFEQMENLVEHMERKAVRAKVLTNSAAKQKPTLASAQKASAKKQMPVEQLPGAERPRPRAVKKIDASSFALTPMKPEEAKRQKQLPTPRKIVAVTQPKSLIPTRPPLAVNNAKPAFNLSTTVVSKMFIPSAASATKTNVASKPADALQSKVEARRQRHMAMFKGRTAKEKPGEFVRGVRSNRRFELQMQHRRQMDENVG